VIAVTASALGDIRQTARDAGCADYLSKPVRVQSLFGMLQTHLGVRFVGAADPRAARDEAQIDMARRSELAGRLRSAIALGDVSELEQLARVLMGGGTAEAEMGERIARLAMNFDFGGLSELADSLGA
jgi:CheY-like chemotaxis protein